MLFSYQQTLGVVLSCSANSNLMQPATGACVNGAHRCYNRQTSQLHLARFWENGKMRHA